MVYFTCQGCGDALKKPQVEKHKQQCRRSRVLTCHDCCKDFPDDEYQTHTKCVSEDQRYGGANYKAKENKGEVKQEKWFEQVQRAIETVNSSNVQVLKLLERLRNYPNIPRKEQKFKNFLSNSLRERNSKIVSEAWLAISKAETVKNESADKKRAADDNDPSENGNRTKKIKIDECPTNSDEKSVSEEVATKADEKSAKNGENSTIEQNSSNGSIKLKSLMKKILKESESGSMKIRKLKKRIAVSMNIGDDEAEKEKIYIKIDSKLTSKIDLFVLEGKIVKLKR